ncbi:MAG: hypothetical protein FWC00_02150 [Firmicutes bacterium]|nr:hypothetical protein [Bacillota bacterium]
MQIDEKEVSRVERVTKMMVQEVVAATGLDLETATTLIESVKEGDAGDKLSQGLESAGRFSSEKVTNMIVAMLYEKSQSKGDNIGLVSHKQWKETQMEQVRRRLEGAKARVAQFDNNERDKEDNARYLADCQNEHDEQMEKINSADEVPRYLDFAQLSEEAKREFQTQLNTAVQAYTKFSKGNGNYGLKSAEREMIKEENSFSNQLKNLMSNVKNTLAEKFNISPKEVKEKMEEELGFHKKELADGTDELNTPSEIS